MYKNYFYLFRCVNELKNILVGKKICEIYTQEKDKLFVNVPSEENPEFHLIISVNPQQHYIVYRTSHHKAKKNTINFFEHILPDEIKSIKIAEGDRLIKFELCNVNLYAAFRGSHSNILLEEPGGIFSSFKKIDRAKLAGFREEISKTTFSDSLAWISRIINDENDTASLKKLPFIGKEIFHELEFRNDPSPKHSLQKIIREIVTEPIAVFFDESTGKQSFCPRTFQTVQIPSGVDLFDNYSDATGKYFSLSFSKSKAKNIRAEIEKHLSKETERLSNKLNNLKVRIDSGSKEKLYRQYGDILFSNIRSLHKGMNEFSFEDSISGEKLKIQLDGKLSPNQNVDKYYDKSRSEKLEYQKSVELFSSTRREYEQLIEIRNKFESTKDDSELLQIKKELKMNPQTPQLEYKKEKFSFRHFVIDKKYNVYVGKDSKNNDALTTKFAKQNDFWFHARSVSGSHVVLKIENTQEAIPKSVLYKAASLAAFYSKAKSSRLAPVTYTLKKYVVKNQRHDPGQVTVTKENVLLVKPEIPKDCEMIDE